MNYNGTMTYLEKPRPLDENDLRDRYLEALDKVFIPYCESGDADDCSGALEFGITTWPLLHLLALVKSQGYIYSPDMVGRLADAMPDFLRNQWLHSNKLLREQMRLVSALHDAGKSDFGPSKFFYLAVNSINAKHLMPKQVMREMLFPIEYGPDAATDPMTKLIGDLLANDQDLCRITQPEGLDDLRFASAVKHYTRQSLAFTLNKPKRWDTLLCSDLGA